MYYMASGLLHVLSPLPLRVLYLLSDFAYFIVYHIIGYRKKVVLHNLSIAFPEKGEGEKVKIARLFYKNFIDSLIETIKLLTASNRFIQEHFTGDYTIFENLFTGGATKCQVHLGHFFNWEYGNVSFPLSFRHKLLTVYMPISNKNFDKLFKRMRSKTGAVLLPATDMRNAILPFRNEAYILALVADQNPGDPRNAFWIHFFSKPAPFLKAPENAARRGNIPVVFSHFTKRKRGFYQAHFTLANDNPAHTEPGELTRSYVKYLEEAIRQQPDMWLWSHRRWKWDWKEEYGMIME